MLFEASLEGQQPLGSSHLISSSDTQDWFAIALRWSLSATNHQPTNKQQQSAALRQASATVFASHGGTNGGLVNIGADVILEGLPDGASEEGGRCVGTMHLHLVFLLVTNSIILLFPAVFQVEARPNQPNGRDTLPKESWSRSLVDSLGLCSIYKQPNTSNHKAANPHGVRRIFWLHIPKCGTSFATTLFHAACPKLPLNASLPSVAEFKELKSKSLVAPFIERYPQDEYCVPDVWVTRPEGHHPMTDSIALKRVTFAMFRHPSARLYSAYNHNLHADKMANGSHSIMKKMVRNIRDFSFFPGVPECQVKVRPCLISLACEPWQERT